MVTEDVSALLTGAGLAHADEDQAVAADPSLALDVPGLIAEHLRHTEDQAVHKTFAAGRTVRRDQGYSVRVATLFSVHQAALSLCSGFATEGVSLADRKAHRVYADRIIAASTTA
ncbi:hypothetical protein [Streptomyces sp. bgisy082]|uniref:hypothetical protein n=1 Tax=Streptomyces sp. bgisy082 TaxID=3413776 RepID=UPI003D72E029